MGLLLLPSQNGEALKKEKKKQEHFEGTWERHEDREQLRA